MFYGNLKEKIGINMGVFMGLLSYLFGGFDPLLSIFVTILIIDTVSGMLKAWNLGQYESSKFRSGFTKKSAYLLGIILAVQVDKLISGNSILRDAVLTFFTANESFSIIENLGQMGVKFPPALSNAIKALNSNNDSNTDINEETEK